MAILRGGVGGVSGRLHSRHRLLEEGKGRLHHLGHICSKGGKNSRPAAWICPECQLEALLAWGRRQDGVRDPRGHIPGDNGDKS